MTTDKPTRKRRTDAEIAADLQRKLDAHNAKVAERERKETEKAERQELERKRKVLAGLDADQIQYVQAALASCEFNNNVCLGSDVLALLRGEGA